MINFYTLWDDSKALLKGCDDNDDVERPFSPNCEEKVAVLSILPPSRNVRALCALQYHDKLCDPYTKLLEDPVSLCIVGGLQSKIIDFCTEHGKAHGISFKYFAALFGGFFLAMCLMISFLIRYELFRRLYILYWMAFAVIMTFLTEKAHKTSGVYLDSHRQFWHSLSKSNLESKISAMLERCGYSCEIDRNVEASSWTLSIYKKGSVQTSLPMPGDDIDDGGEAEQSAKKSWMICRKVGWFDDRVGNDDGQYEPTTPLDMWTIRGLNLGRSLNARKTHKSTQLFALLEACGMLVFFVFNPPQSDLVFWLGVALLPHVLLITIVIFNDLVDKPKHHRANEALCRLLAPVIRDRHNGRSLHYEIRPIETGFLRFFWWMKRGVIVVGLPTNDAVDEAPAHNDSIELC